jgi:hypothetical protein
MVFQALLLLVKKTKELATTVLFEDRLQAGIDSCVIG